MFLAAVFFGNFGFGPLLVVAGSRDRTEPKIFQATFSFLAGSSRKEQWSI